MVLMNYREPNQVKWVGVRPAHNGEQIAKSVLVNNTTNILYTVPTGKTFFLTQMNILEVYGSTGGNSIVRLYDGLGNIIDTFHLHPWFSSATDVVNIMFNPPYEIPENYYISVSSGALNQIIFCHITGWLE